MSTGIVIVIIGGLVLGYWCVSSLMSAMEKGGKRRHEEGSNTCSGETWSSDQQSGHQNETTSRNQSGLTWFTTLGVMESATLEEITTAYKSLIRKYHPDKVAALGDELKEIAEKKSKQINVAYSYACELRRRH